MKRCTKCAKEKPLSDFYYQKRREQYTAACKACCLAASEKCRQGSKEKYDAIRKRWKKLHPEAMRAMWRRYRLRNKERRLAQYRIWQKANAARCLERARLRKTQQARACPAWANRAAMVAIYEEARKITKHTGIPHEVDHIVPLKSPIVCGLHCETNLRIIPATENKSKKNLYWPGMP